MKNSLSSRAMTIAHQIKKNFANFSTALRAAWQIAKISAGQRTNITFAKDGGELREAIAINCGSLQTIEKGFVRFVEWISEDKTQWRSFKIERLIVA